VKKPVSKFAFQVHNLQRYITDGRPFVKATANNHLKAFVSQQLAMLMVSALQIRTGWGSAG
jgi:hypothetical protein